MFGVYKTIVSIYDIRYFDKAAWQIVVGIIMILSFCVYLIILYIKIKKTDKTKTEEEVKQEKRIVIISVIGWIIFLAFDILPISYATHHIKDSTDFSKSLSMTYMVNQNEFHKDKYCSNMKIGDQKIVKDSIALKYGATPCQQCYVGTRYEYVYSVKNDSYYHLKPDCKFVEPNLPIVKKIRCEAKGFPCEECCGNN